jgi:hypothetical protein
MPKSSRYMDGNREISEDHRVPWIAGLPLWCQAMPKKAPPSSGTELALKSPDPLLFALKSRIDSAGPRVFAGPPSTPTHVS